MLFTSDIPPYSLTGLSQNSSQATHQKHSGQGCWTRALHLYTDIPAIHSRRRRNSKINYSFHCSGPHNPRYFNIHLEKMQIQIMSDVSLFPKVSSFKWLQGMTP